MKVLKFAKMWALWLFLFGGVFAQEWGWSEPQQVEELGYAACPYLSHDEQIMLLSPGGIFMSRWTGYQWGPLEWLPEPINSEHLEHYAVITPANDYFYWVSWRPGGYGGWDIWRCSWDENTNTFGEAECLGENINSGYNEFGVCFSPDGNRLYFSSSVFIKNGQQGYGDQDIWYCDWDSTLNDWGLPYNCGNFINTTGADYYPYTSRSGMMANYKLYFSSGHHHNLPGWQGALDIFSVTWDGSNWSDLTNIGTPINSPIEDKSPCVTDNGMTMYFATRENREPYAIMIIMRSNWEQTSVIDFKNSSMPIDSEIDIYPNPFNTTCQILLNPNKDSMNASLKIFNLLGKEVRDLGEYSLSGPTVTKWDGAENNGIKVSSGQYFLEVLYSNGLKQTKSISLLK